MELVNLKVTQRESFGQGPARRLRYAGKVPGIIYGHNVKNVAITVDAKEINTIIRRHIGRNYILNLLIENDKNPHERWIIIRESQRDPLTEELVHVDLYELNQTEPVILKVPLRLTGNPVGVRAGGILEVVSREIAVKCLPKDIPESIVINIAHLNIGDSVQVESLAKPEFEIMTDPNTIIAHVVVMKALPTPEEEAATAAAATAATAAATPTAAVAATPAAAEPKKKK